MFEHRFSLQGLNLYSKITPPSLLFRIQIIQAMRKELNTVYNQYCLRNPLFQERGGKVSIIAHSLGSVIIHDLLTLWNSYLLEKDKKNADSQVACGER